MKKALSVFVMFMTVLSFNGCITTPICVSPAASHFQGRMVIENLGHCTGSDSACSVFGLYMIGRPDIGKAVKEAVESRKGDALINVRCYEKWSYYLFFSVNTVIVEGDAVKLSASSGDTEKKPRGK